MKASEIKFWQSIEKLSRNNSFSSWKKFSAFSIFTLRYDIIYFLQFYIVFWVRYFYSGVNVSKYLLLTSMQTFS